MKKTAVSCLALLMVGTLAANALALGPGGITPATASDAPKVVNTGYFVYNQSTTSDAMVVGDFGSISNNVSAGAVLRSLNIYNGGGTFNCTLWAVSLSNGGGASAIATASTSTVGTQTLAFIPTVSQGVHAALSVSCVIPRFSGSFQSGIWSGF